MPRPDGHQSVGAIMGTRMSVPGLAMPRARGAGERTRARTANEQAGPVAKASAPGRRCPRCGAGHPFRAQRLGPSPGGRRSARRSQCWYPFVPCPPGAFQAQRPFPQDATTGKGVRDGGLGERAGGGNGMARLALGHKPGKAFRPRNLVTGGVIGRRQRVSASAGGPVCGPQRAALSERKQGER